MNKIFLLGNLGKDPESRFTNSGLAVSQFSVATSKRVKGKSGDYEEQTTWHRCTAYGKLAEICNQILAKGDKVLITGYMSHREYEKDGTKRTISEAIVEEMTKVSGKADKPKSESKRPADYMDEEIPF